MTADPLAPLDLAFWNLESAGHPMHLAALGVFTAGSPSAAARAYHRARAAHHPSDRIKKRSERKSWRL
ncbi:wax ester/triacylglycerol synthase domain-containing protein, partial [Streptomyces cellulosae]